MKIPFLLILSLLISFASAQDILIFKNGNQVDGKYPETKEGYVIFQRQARNVPSRYDTSLIDNIKLMHDTVIPAQDKSVKDRLFFYSGHGFEGKLIKINDDTLSFAISGNTVLNYYAIENVVFLQTNKGILIDVFEIAKSDSIRDNFSFKEVHKLLGNELLRAQCEANNKVLVLVLPFKDDLYGITQTIQDNFDSLCYNIIPQYSGLSYFHEKNVLMDNLNDFHIINMGKELGVNFVVYGFAYKVEVPFNYAPTTTDPYSLFSTTGNDLWNQIRNSLMGFFLYNKQVSTRSRAIREAGTYVNITYYIININSGEKIFLLTNEVVLKLNN